MITPADIKIKFPEFASLSDSLIQSYLDEAYLEVDEGRAGDYYDLLIYYLTAHYIALALQASSGQNRGSGIVTSMSVGDTSIGFGGINSNSNADFYYQQTSYGLRYLKYRTLTGGGGIIV